MATFSERAIHSAEHMTVLFVLCLFVILGISRLWDFGS